jgi:6-phosphofructo-2-kinase / fructose-2,6-biphosphatase 4
MAFPRTIPHHARSELGQLNPGDADTLTPLECLARWPEEAGQRQRDPYHHRYPRGESYHDLANRLWTVMLEMERETKDLLIIAHESVLRVLCAYFLEMSADVRPSAPVSSTGFWGFVLIWGVGNSIYEFSEE